MNRTELMRDIAKFARMLAKYSPCKRRGVACVVFDKLTMQIVGYGWNQPAEGVMCTGEKDRCGCLHSEVQCILNCRPQHSSNIMIASRAPCTNCASAIVNCKFIDAVYILDDSEPGAAGVAVLKACGIHVEKLYVPEAAEIGLRDSSMEPSKPTSFST